MTKVTVVTVQSEGRVCYTAVFDNAEKKTYFIEKLKEMGYKDSTFGSETYIIEECNINEIPGAHFEEWQEHESKKKEHLNDPNEDIKVISGIVINDFTNMSQEELPYQPKSSAGITVGRGIGKQESTYCINYF